MSDHILLTTDFSDCARAAYPWAARVSRALDLPVRVFHVVDTLSHVQAEHLPLRTDWDRQVGQVVQGRLETVKTWFEDQNVPVSIASRAGIPWREIQRELGRARLGVIAAHGYGAIGRFLMGSVATKVLRHASVPVLVVHPDTPDRPVRRVLYPASGEVGRGCLQEAIEFVERFGAPMEIFHASVAPETLVLVGSELSQAVAGDFTRERLEAGQRLVASLAKDAESLTTTVTTRVEEALRIAPAIVARAETIDADLIVMPAHEMSRGERWLLGSVTEEVIRRSHRPILVLRAPPEE